LAEFLSAGAFKKADFHSPPYKFKRVRNANAHEAWPINNPQRDILLGKGENDPEEAIVIPMQWVNFFCFFYERGDSNFPDKIKLVLVPIMVHNIGNRQVFETVKKKFFETVHRPKFSPIL
jgi:hypothetical protein